MVTEMDLAGALGRSLTMEWAAWSEVEAGVLRHAGGSWISVRDGPAGPMVTVGLGADLRQRRVLSGDAALAVSEAIDRSRELAREDLFAHIAADVALGATDSQAWAPVDD